jgi:hypothetical protein
LLLLVHPLFRASLASAIEPHACARPPQAPSLDIREGETVACSRWHDKNGQPRVNDVCPTDAVLSIECDGAVRNCKRTVIRGQWSVIGGKHRPAFTHHLPTTNCQLRGP